MVQESSGIGDLAYVRSVVERAEGRPITPPIIFYLWAIIVLGGYLVNLYQPAYALTYWVAVPLIGVVLSSYLGRRHFQALGINSRRLGRRYGFHWLIFMAGFGLLLPLVKAGVIDWQGFNAVMVLIIGLFYILAALHLDGSFLFVGLVMVAAYLVMLYFPALSGWIFVASVVGALALTGAVLQFSSGKPYLKMGRES